MSLLERTWREIRIILAIVVWVVLAALVMIQMGSDEVMCVSECDKRCHKEKENDE